jgi:Lipocalin-like domain
MQTHSEHPSAGWAVNGAHSTEAQFASCLHGTWKMLSWRTEDLATGQTADALGANPEGYISYMPDGRVMVLVLRDDRKKPAALVPTDEEKIALYDSMFAYAGTYTVDHEKVVHQIDMSWNHSWTGTSQIRFYTVSGDELTYVTAPAKNPTTGRDCVHTVLFRRVR